MIQLCLGPPKVVFFVSRQSNAKPPNFLTKDRRKYVILLGPKKRLK